MNQYQSYQPTQAIGPNQIGPFPNPVAGFNPPTPGHIAGGIGGAVGQTASNAGTAASNAAQNAASSALPASFTTILNNLSKPATWKAIAIVGVAILLIGSGVILMAFGQIAGVENRAVKA